MTTDHGPLQTEPTNIRPPWYGRPPQPGGLDACRAALLDAIGPDVELGDYDRRIIDWLAGWDVSTVGAIASLLYRVRAASEKRPHVNETSTGGYMARLPIPGETYRGATEEPVLPHGYSDPTGQDPIGAAEQGRRLVQIGVFCDRCEITDERDYLCSGIEGREARFGYARDYLTEHEGWRCDEDGDFCPACVTALGAEADAALASLAAQSPAEPRDLRAGVAHEIEIGRLAAAGTTDVYAVDCVCGWMAVDGDGRALGFHDESDAVIAYEEHVQQSEVPVDPTPAPVVLRVVAGKPGHRGNRFRENNGVLETLGGDGVNDWVPSLWSSRAEMEAAGYVLTETEEEGQ